SVAISARVDGESLQLEVADDGGGAGSKEQQAPGVGIGLRNTADRLRALYGETQQLVQEARPGGGLSVRIRIPLEVPKTDSLSCAPEVAVA
ncbi:MAG: hypothetical protein ACKO4A_04600, partial [Gammaproteobacteria bacterium]